MKLRCRILTVVTTIALFMSIALLTAFSVNAAEMDTSVTYTHTEDTKVPYSMYVAIVGNGIVYDGDQVLFKSGSTYLLKDGQEKVFCIRPTNDYQLVSVIYDNENITQQVSRNGYVTVIGKAYDTQLIINFEKAEGNHNVQTGDANSNLILCIVLILSFGLISTIVTLFIINKYKKQNKH